MNRPNVTELFETVGSVPLPASMTVPQAGSVFCGLNRTEAYAAAQRGEIPCVRVGADLRVPTHWALKQHGYSEAEIGYAMRVPLADVVWEAPFLACSCYDPLDDEGTDGLEHLAGFSDFVESLPQVTP